MVAHRGLESLEEVRIVAYFFTFPTRVAVRVAEQIDIGIGVGADESKDEAATAAVIVAAITALPTTTGRVTDEQLDDVRRKSEEGVHEGASDHAAPVVAHQSMAAGVLLIEILPVPICSVA